MNINKALLIKLGWTNTRGEQIPLSVFVNQGNRERFERQKQAERDHYAKARLKSPAPAAQED